MKAHLFFIFCHFDASKQSSLKKSSKIWPKKDQNPTFKTPVCSTTSLILGSTYICIAAIDREVETKITFVKFHLTELLNIVHVPMQLVFFAYFPISSLLKFGKIVLFVTFTGKKWGFEEGGESKYFVVSLTW